MAIIGIGICIGENLLLGISIKSVHIFLYQWNPNTNNSTFFAVEKYYICFLVSPIMTECMKTQFSSICVALVISFNKIFSSVETRAHTKFNQKSFYAHFAKTVIKHKHAI